MKRSAVVLTALLCLAGPLAGCSSTAMRGTPFYKGPRPQGKAPDRVNLWPIVYYEQPVLSVLWPFGQFDSATHRNRFFPAFWGSPEGEAPYFFVPPLAWFQKGVVAGVWPLFLWFSRPGGSSYHILWPIVNWKTGSGETGWRVWPLYGQYGEQSEGIRYALWPFVVFMRSGEDVVRWALPFYAGSRGTGGAWDDVLLLFFRQRSDAVRRLAFFPLFYDSRDAKGNRTLLTPLYMMGRNGPDLWDLVLPFFYRSKSPEGTSMAALPLFYKRTDADGGWTFVSPIYSGGRRTGSAWDLALPLYFRYQGARSRAIVVLPAYFSSQSGSVLQRLLFPLFYTWTDGKSSLLLTLPYGLSKSGQTRTAYAFPLLSALTTGPQGKELWALFPLSHWRWQDGLQQADVLPFFYWDRASDTFLSLPYAHWADGDTRYTSVLGPLYVGVRGKDAGSTNVLWPVFKRWTDKEGTGQRVWPLYSYRRGDGTAHLTLGPSLGDAALIGATWNKDYHHTWLFPLFLKSWKDSAGWVRDGKGLEMDTRERSFILFPLVWQHSSTPLPATTRAVPRNRHAKGPSTPPPRPHGYFSILPLFGSGYDGDMKAPRGPAESSFWLLGWLYDSKRQLRPSAADPSKRYLYVRRRILWRVMNYERVNDSPSLDVFPGITYDNTPGKRKVVSFLWRVFRYEWDKDKGTRVHVLFIPFGGGKAEEEPTQEPARPMPPKPKPVVSPSERMAAPG